MCENYRFAHWDQSRTLVKFQKSQNILHWEWIKKKVLKENLKLALPTFQNNPSLYFLIITYPSICRSFNLEHPQTDVRMGEIWHQHLDFMRTMHSENKHWFWLAVWESRITRLKVWKCNTHFFNQLNSVVANSSTWSHMVVRRTQNSSLPLGNKRKQQSKHS